MTQINSELKDEIATEILRHLYDAEYDDEELLAGFCEALGRVAQFDSECVEDCIDFLRELVDEWEDIEDDSDDLSEL